MKGDSRLDMLQTICIIFLFNVDMRIQADIYTSTTELIHLLDVHMSIKEYLFLYLERHTKRLATLKSYLNILTQDSEKAMADIPNYIENPINMFTLIKRLTIDFHFIKYSIEDETDNQYMKNTTYKYYPTAVDMQGAADALVRLQRIYKIEVKEMAEGKLNGIASSSPMTACDCYDLGQALYDKKDFWNGIAWMVEALHKYKEEEEKEKVQYPISEIDLIEHISFGYSKIGDMESALEWIQKINDIDPQNPRTEQIVRMCRKKMMDPRYKLVGTRIKKREKKRQKLERWYELNVYPLCRGDAEIPIEVTSRLTCRYMAENHPFLKLAPFKTEMLYLNPDIVLFHDVLTDKEIKNIIELASNKLKRSEILDFENTPSYSKHRISKTASLDATQRFAFDRRIAHMTGLNLKKAEIMQVANYGIGGFYDLHYDWHEDGPQDMGQRIATVLFYLSDVTQGGATIFNHLGLSVFPKKGSAIYWFNLHASGEPNHCLQHGACPVLQGSKWVSTKWINLIGQEFIKPCNLQYQKAGCIQYFPSPIIKNTSRTRIQQIEDYF